MSRNSMALGATIVLIAAECFVASAHAATYYVSPVGADTNPGSSAQPFRTIQRAADLVNPGDTVIVEDGTYTGTGDGTACASTTQLTVVCLARGGTSTAPVTFRARNPLGAKIDGRSNTDAYGFQFLASYIRVEGFDVFGMGHLTKDAAGFVIYYNAHDITVAHNAIHNIGRLCTDHQYGMIGIYIQNARVTVDGNRIYDIGRFAPGESGCKPTTINYQTHDHGIYVNGKDDGTAPGARDVLIMNNRFSNLARGWGIQVYPDPVVNLRILNNAFSDPNPYQLGQIIIGASTTNARLINNVFVNPTTAGIYFYQGTQTGMTISNSISSLAISDKRPAGVTFANNLESTDAQLAQADLRPAPTSPAINKGATLLDVPWDAVGTPRPVGPAADIGPFEFVSSGPPPAPTNVRIIR